MTLLVSSFVWFYKRLAFTVIPLKHGWLDAFYFHCTTILSLPNIIMAKRKLTLSLSFCASIFWMNEDALILLGQPHSFILFLSQTWFYFLTSAHSSFPSCMPLTLFTFFLLQSIFSGIFSNDCWLMFLQDCNQGEWDAGKCQYK